MLRSFLASTQLSCVPIPDRPDCLQVVGWCTAATINFPPCCVLEMVALVEHHPRHPWPSVAHGSPKGPFSSHDPGPPSMLRNVTLAHMHTSSWTPYFPPGAIRAVVPFFGFSKSFSQIRGTPPPPLAPRDRRQFVARCPCSWPR